MHVLRVGIPWSGDDGREPGSDDVAVAVAVAGGGWGADVEGWAEDALDGPVA